MKLNKYTILTIILILLISSTTVYGADPSIIINNPENTVESVLNNIKDDVVKERIVDFYSICYIVVSTDQNISFPINNTKIIIDNIHSLSELNEKQLNILIINTINTTIGIIKTNPDAYLLPSASAVFEKYNFSEELKQLECITKSTHFSSENNASASVSIIDKTWTKTATGTINHALLGFPIATYNMKISWVVKNSKITSYTKAPSGSADPTYYTYISSRIISESIPPLYLGQRANVKCSGKFKKLIQWNPYDYVILDIWFYNDGGFDVSVSH
jgi:hypothetical protein